MTATLPQVWFAEEISQPDIITEGLGRMLIQYQNAPRLKAFLRAFLQQLQNIDRAALQVLAGGFPATAIGVQLDRVGKIVVQKRGELEDEPFRILVLGKIFVNKADGQRPQFLELLVDILGLTEPVLMYEWYPAHLRIVTTLTEYPLQIWEMIRAMAPGGVEFEYVFSALSYANVFTTSSNYGTDVIDVNRGTANYTGTTGGKLADMRKLP